MKCQEYGVKLSEDDIPSAINVRRQVPIPLGKKTEQELKRMEQNGLVPRIDETTEWCRVRICVDLILEV